MTQYKSRYERYLTELNEQGYLIRFTPEENVQILEALNEGMEEFNNEQRVKERQSEFELASVILI